MNSSRIFGLAILVAGSTTSSAASIAPAPTFNKLAGTNADHVLPGNAIQKPQSKLAPSPRLTEVRMVPGADGKLHQVCREVANPKRERDTDALTPQDGEQR
ncbi:MAG: hypothetical protein ABI411_15235 [Tahibacter sp.]